jgi:hypothetical protein
MSKIIDVASSELTRICTLGGDWNGFVAGCNSFDDTEVFASFDSFKRNFAASIKSTPFIHYETDKDCVFLINDSDSTDLAGAEVLRMELPDDLLLQTWYQERLHAMENDS